MTTACTLNYINNIDITLTDGSVVPITDRIEPKTKKPLTEFLTELHHSVAEDLLLYDKFKINSYSYTKTGETKMSKFLYLPTGKNKDKLIEYIEAKNLGYGTIYGVDSDLIKFRKVTVNGREFIAIVVDSSPFISTLPDVLDYTHGSSDIEFESGFFDLYFKGIQEDEVVTSDNFIYDKNTGSFFNILKNELKPRLSTFIKNNTGTTTLKDKKFLKDMYSLQSNLKSLDKEAQLFAVRNFLQNGLRFVETSTVDLHKYKKEYDELMSTYNHEDNNKEKISKLADLATNINKIKDKLYLYEYLNEFLDEFKSQGIEDNVFEIYNKFRVQRLVKHLIKDTDLADQIIDRAINTVYKSNSEFEDKLLKDLYKHGAIIDDENIIKSTLYTSEEKKEGIVSNLEKATFDMQKMIPNVRQLIIDITSATLYPSIASSWSEKNDAFELSFKPTLEQFKLMLEDAEENPDILKLFLAAGEQQQDYVLKATAKLLHDVLKTEDIKARKNAVNALDNLRGIFKTESIKDLVNNSKRLELNKEMSTYIFEVPETEVITLSDKKDDQIIDESGIYHKITSTNTDVTGKELEVQTENGQWYIKVKDISGDKWVKVNRTKALIHDFSYKQEIENKVFINTLDFNVMHFSKFIDSARTSELSTEQKLNLILDEVKKFNYSDTLQEKIEQLIKNLKYGNMPDYGKDLSQQVLRKALFKDFINFHYVPESDDVTIRALDNLKFKDINHKDTQKWILKNARESAIQIYDNGNLNLFSSIRKNPQNLIGYNNQYLIKTKDDEVKLATILLNNDEYTITVDGSNFKLTDIASFFFKDRELLKQSSYYTQKQEEINHNNKLISDKIYNSYYHFLKDSHDKSNEDVIVSKLNNMVLPQMRKKEAIGIKEQLLGIKDTIANKKVADSVIKKIKKLSNGKKLTIYTNNKGEYVDEHGDLLPAGVEPLSYYQNIQNLDGFDALKLTPKYVSRLSNQDNVEGDLMISFLSFSDSTSKYKALSEIEPQIKFLKLINKGSTQTISKTNLFSGRKFNTGNKTSLQAKIQKASSPYLVNNLEDFINHFMYGKEKVNADWFGIDGQKVSSAIKGLNAFQSLAFNFVSAFTNIEVGAFSNYSIGVGSKFGLKKEHINEGYKIYFKNLHDIVTSRFKTNNLYERDHLTQLALTFDAIKGDAVEVGETFNKKTTILDKLKKGIYVTSSAPEHLNQIPLMIGFMKSYIIEEGFTMWDAYEDGSKGKVTINLVNKAGESLDDSTILDFYNKLDIINSEAHGNYGKYQTAMAERYAMLSLGMQFSRWVYTSINSRFHKGKYNLQTEEYVNRGYQRWYLKSLLKEVIDVKNEYFGNEAEVTDSLKIVKDLGFRVIGKTFVNFTAKQALFFVNTLSQQTLSNKNKWVNDFLYGDRDRIIIEEQLEKLPDESEEDFQKRVDKNYDMKKKALMRASFEISIFIMTAIIGAMLSAISDDDDEAIKLLEIQIKRLNADIGLFTPSVNPFKSYDFLSNKMKDPLVTNRLLDNNINFLIQLGGFSFNNEGINLNYNDVYEKAGAGYSVGDSKLYRKMKKTILAPLGQVIRLTNPDELENTLRLYNRNSIIQIDND